MGPPRGNGGHYDDEDMITDLGDTHFSPAIINIEPCTDYVREYVDEEHEFIFSTGVWSNTMPDDHLISRRGRRDWR